MDEKEKAWDVRELVRQSQQAEKQRVHDGRNDHESNIEVV